ncbi:MAG TPA: hypothetical protein VID95_12610 [Candidatus Limnocylindrales bacterium]|jgi:hypothetical protein
MSPPRSNPDAGADIRWVGWPSIVRGRSWSSGGRRMKAMVASTFAC